MVYSQDWQDAGISATAGSCEANQAQGHRPVQKNFDR